MLTAAFALTHAAFAADIPRDPLPRMVDRDGAGRRIGARYRQVDELGIVELSLDAMLEPGEATLFFVHDAPFRTGGYGDGVFRKTL